MACAAASPAPPSLHLTPGPSRPSTLNAPHTRSQDLQRVAAKQEASLLASLRAGQEQLQDVHGRAQTAEEELAATRAQLAAAARLLAATKRESRAAEVAALVAFSALVLIGGCCLAASARG